MITNAILFDLDGTLTDPKLGIVNSIQYALTQIGTDAIIDRPRDILTILRERESQVSSPGC